MKKASFAILALLSVGAVGIANARGLNVLGLVGGQALQSGGSTVLVTVPVSPDKLDLCTGVIIARDTVLTAAHCLAHSIGMDQIQLSFSRNREDKDVPTREVRNGLAHEGFRLGDSSTPDLALLRFEGGLPPGYAPVALATDALEIQAGDLLYLAGYGKTEINSPVPTGQTGVLHGDYFAVANPAAPNDEISFKVDRNHSTAVGDSGGPAYWVSAERVALVGISKHVVYYQHDWRWVDRAYYTRVAPYRTWIEATMVQLRAKAPAPSLPH